MKCPVCTDVNLAMSDRQGIEIDYCPQCRGVWLDRGELDKLIERSAADTPPPPRPQQPRNDRPQSYDSREQNYYKHKKKKSLFGELFDF